MTTGGEVAAVAKAGVSVVQGLLRSQQAPPFPDMRDALLELFAILSEWVVRTQAITDYLHHTLQVPAPDRAQVNGGVGSARVGIQFGVVHGRVGPDGRKRILVDEIMEEIEAILDGRAPWSQRWSDRKRRQANRRSLRTILDLYAPDVLDNFERAINERRDWVERNRDKIDQWHRETHTDEETRAMIAEAGKASAGLIKAKEDLRRYIRETYPMAAGDA